MSRIHRRDPRGDWLLEADYGNRYRSYGITLSSSFTYAPPPVFRVSLMMTTDQARELLDTIYGQPGSYRGSPSWSAVSYHAASAGYVSVRDIEVTEEEAHQIAHGTHPLDVLLAPAWDCGYRLTVRPADLSGR